jgi:hypothetical protein
VTVTRLEGFATLVDLAPTILSMVGVDPTATDMDGRSFLSLAEQAGCVMHDHLGTVDFRSVLDLVLFQDRSVRSPRLYHRVPRRAGRGSRARLPAVSRASLRRRVRSVSGRGDVRDSASLPAGYPRLLDFGFKESYILVRKDGGCRRGLPLLQVGILLSWILCVSSLIDSLLCAQVRRHVSDRRVLQYHGGSLQLT